MDTHRKVTVQPGRVVRYNKETYHPGESFDCVVGEAVRLWLAEAVELDDFESLADISADLSREDILVQVMDCLDPDKANKEDWTRSGMPQTSLLSEIMGEIVSAADRDVAYGRYLEVKAGEEKS